MPRSGSRVRVSFSAQKVSFPLTFFYALTVALFLGLAAPFSLLWRAGEDVKKARVHVADVGSSLVFRSSSSLASVGLFSYMSVGYACHTCLCRCSGCICDFSESGWTSGKKRVISWVYLPLSIWVHFVISRFRSLADADNGKEIGD